MLVFKHSNYFVTVYFKEIFLKKLIITLFIFCLSYSFANENQTKKEHMVPAMCLRDLQYVETEDSYLFLMKRSTQKIESCVPNSFYLDISTVSKKIQEYPAFYGGKTNPSNRYFFIRVDKK